MGDSEGFPIFVSMKLRVSLESTRIFLQNQNYVKIRVIRGDKTMWRLLMPYSVILSI